MTWNHRVIKKTYNEEEIFSIEEVMYDTKDHSLQGQLPRRKRRGLSLSNSTNEDFVKSSPVLN